MNGKGVILPDFQERGAHDYRKDACLTLYDFERIIIYSIIYYNSERIIENFPFSREMIAQKVPPNSSQIWNWGIKEMGAHLISVSEDMLRLTLLPRTTGKFGRKGLIANRLRYKHEDYAEQYLMGNSVVVAYDPDDSTFVWLIENGSFVRFELIESRFAGMELSEVETLMTAQRSMVIDAGSDRLQA